MTATENRPIRLRSRADRLLAPVILTWAAVWGVTQYWDQLEPWRTWAIAAVSVLVALTLLSWLGWRSHVYEIDSEHISESTGVLRRRRREVAAAAITAVETSQSLWQRTLGAGDLHLEIGDGESLRLRHVPDPRAVQRLITEIAAESRVRMRHTQLATFETVALAPVGAQTNESSLSD